jgi:hypothetical protein
LHDLGDAGLEVVRRELALRGQFAGQRAIGRLGLGRALRKPRGVRGFGERGEAALGFGGERRQRIGRTRCFRARS